MRRADLSLWFGVFTAPASLALIASYSLWRAPRATELELIFVNLTLLLVILFPRLRSRLLRRRSWVGAWMREGHWLRSLLRGGALYMSVQLIIAIPASLLLLVELQNLTLEMWTYLLALGALCALIRVALFRQLSSPLRVEAASVITREWATWCFFIGAATLTLWYTLYTPQPDLASLSLQDALLLSTEQQPEPSGDGVLNEVMWVTAVKESVFWWTILNAPRLLVDLPELVRWAAQVTLIGVYALYHLSALFALSQYVAGSLECVDRHFYRFLRGTPPGEG